MPVATAFQTIGPYWALIEHPEMADLTRFGATGEKMVLTGRVLDGDGSLVRDGVVELWQSSPAASDQFPGWGRSGTDGEGRYRFTTLKPGPVPGRGNAQQAPHFALTLFGRGILTRLVTRAYFAGEPLNETDPVLSLVEDPRRRATLLAEAGDAGVWTMDIRLQGENETVFLDF